MSGLKEAAVRLFHAREKKQLDDLIKIMSGEDPGPAPRFPAYRIWFWSIKRWKDFPYLEYEMRDEQ